MLQKHGSLIEPLGDDRQRDGGLRKGRGLETEGRRQKTEDRRQKTGEGWKRQRVRGLAKNQEAKGSEKRRD